MTSQTQLCDSGCGASAVTTIAIKKGLHAAAFYSRDVVSDWKTPADVDLTHPNQKLVLREAGPIKDERRNRSG